MTEDDLRCSFCGRPQSQVKRLIGGANALICNECVERCRQEIHADERTSSFPVGPKRADKT